MTGHHCSTPKGTAMRTLDTALDVGAGIVDLFCAALDRPLWLACREVDCTVAYYAIEVADWVDDAVRALGRWYDNRTPHWAWRSGISRALFDANTVTTDVWQRSIARWQRITDYWKGEREPERFGTYLRLLQGVAVA